jgi:peptidyl-prolyl cis-trans isomerase C
MHIRHTIAALVLLALPAYAQAPKIDDNALIIEDGPVKVDEGDVLAFLQRVPEDQRGTFRISYDRIASVADAVFVARSLAYKATEAGLDKDPIMQRRLAQARDTLLADAYAEKLKKDVDKIDLAARAKELYTADAEAYRTPEVVVVQHIMVSAMWHSRDEARARIEDYYKQVKGGADFLEIAQRYSDDPGKTRNGGTLAPIELAKFNAPTREALAKVKQGEVTPPVLDESGYHLFKLVERRAPKVPTFEEARERIVANERDRIRKDRSDALLQQIRSSPTVITRQANLDALVIEVDPEVMKKAQDAAAAAQQQQQQRK